MSDKESTNCQNRRKSIIKIFNYMEQTFNIPIKKMKSLVIEELTYIINIFIFK